MKQKQRLRLSQIFNMSFGFLGIQFGFALQNANVSRIFQTLGASIDDIPILWIAAPVTGFLVQPIIGYLSDRTWHPTWGRRRPFFFLGALLASLALFAMPHVKALWIAALLLWVLDASINISMEPFRAFVGDKLPIEQQTTGYAMQTFFIGLGAVIASLLPYFFTNYLGFSNTAPEGVIPDSVKYSFFIGSIVFFLSVLWTVVSSSENPPEDMEQWEKEKRETKGVFTGIKQIFKGISQMPVIMTKLAAVQFFTWLALFSMWIYTTSSIAQNVFGTNDSSSKAFQDAGDWVGVMFTVYNGISAVAAFLLPMLAQKIGKAFTHLICLFIGGLSLIALFFIQDKTMLLVPMFGVGLAWASILTMPYTILAGNLPADKMGFYMGVFNFFIVIPQILAAALLGWVIKLLFQNQSVFAMLIGGFSMLLSAILCLLLFEKKKVDNNTQ